MLKKRRFAKDQVVKVTFIAPEIKGEPVELVGDFNQWTEPVPMKRDRDGNWRATVNLEPGRDYEFRYRVGDDWFNEPDADDHRDNPFGAQNSVVRT